MSSTLQAAPQAESEVVVGSVLGPKATNKPDTWKISVQPDGSQYEKNLWTKDAALVQQMMNRLGQRFSFMCGVSHWSNSQGQPVRSLWINGVSEAPAEQQGLQTLGQAQAPIAALPVAPVPQVQPIVQPIVQALPQAQVQPLAQQVQQSMVQQQSSADIKEERILRETAAKCAVFMLPTLPEAERTFPHLVLIAEGWVRYFVHGAAGIEMAPQASQAQVTPDTQMATTGLQAFPGTEQPPGQFAADDIPF